MVILSSLKFGYKYFSYENYWISLTPKVDSNMQLNIDYGRKRERRALHTVENHNYWNVQI